MSVAVCRSSAVPFLVEKEGIGTMAPNSMHTNTWLPPASELHKTLVETNHNNKVEENPGQFDIWSMIQSQKSTTNSTPASYIHPLMRRSSSLMSQKSLEMCTESLGSETGSDDFSSSFSELEDNAPFPWSSSSSSETEQQVLEQQQQHDDDDDDDEEKAEDEVRRAFGGRKELSSVNYHCSIGRRSQPRSFPPPLPSISRRDGPCLSMRPHRRDGRLVVEAVPVPSQNYLHARRQEGRLLLTFIDATSRRPFSDASITPATHESQDIKQEIHVKEAAVEMQQLEEDEEEAEEIVCYEEEEEEEEEEVEVVDRGTVVEVKVSTQPQQQSGGAMRVHRSSLVINKFVGGAPLTNQNRWTQYPPPRQEEEEGVGSRPPTPAHRRGVTTTTTAAAAAVAASSTISASSEAAAMGERPPSPENKLLFTSKRRNREELLHHMRRCSELRRPLFFWEPCCIATSS